MVYLKRLDCLRLIASVLCLAFPATAQTISWDSSGNGQLLGVYQMRQVVFLTADLAGNLSRRLAASGSISFDGAGHYTFDGKLADSLVAGGAKPLQRTGTYEISAAGYGRISSILNGGGSIYGSVANGIFAGSSTESGYNDLLIAARSPASVPPSGFLEGTYWTAHMDLPSADPATVQTALFQMRLNAQGGTAGDVEVGGYRASAPTTKITQSVSGVSYAVGQTDGRLTFPATTGAFISGEKILYTSADGRLIFGGSTDGYDFFVGLRAGTAAASGLYAQAGLDQDASKFATGTYSLISYQGSFSTSATWVLGHQRVSYAASQGAYDFSYTDTIPAPGGAEYEDTGAIYKIGDGGFARLGFGKGPYLGISLALKYPDRTGSGVFLHPAGIVNAASSAPFTAAISPGSLISLYGTNLASKQAVATGLPFPSTLEKVQVLVNGRQAPVYFVSSGLVSALVPQATEGPIARIEVLNDGVRSNAVTVFVAKSSAGVFTIPSGGLGDGAVLHPDYSRVTSSRPALAGETLALFLTGLGAVDRPVGDGQAGPTSPLSYVTDKVNVIMGGKTATITYAGLAPGLAGLYQVNFVVPAGLQPGSVSLDVAGADSYTAEAVLPFGVSGAAQESVRVRPPRLSTADDLETRSLLRFRLDEETVR